LSPAGLASDNNALQVIIDMLEQGGSSLQERLVTLASRLLAFFASAQFYIGGTIPVVMINAGHIASQMLTVTRLFPDSVYTTESRFA
jgi:hypothetical protein